MGNLEPTLDLYPDRPAAVAGRQELARLTWGMPTPGALKMGAPDMSEAKIIPL